jgi:hypothetical protein
MPQKTTKTTRTRVKKQPATMQNQAQREQMIAEAAYYMAQKRGFVPGCEMQDWLNAEQAINNVQPTA